MPDDARYVVGVGLGSEADAGEVEALIADALSASGAAADDVELVATLDTKTDHPALAGLRWPIKGLPAELLVDVEAPSPSERVATEVGTASVAEAAALLAAGLGGELVIGKRRSAHATVALVRSKPPPRRSLLNLL